MPVSLWHTNRYTNSDSLLICTDTRKINEESYDKPPYNVVYKELFMDTVNIKKDTVVETTGNFEIENLEHGGGVKRPRANACMCVFP